MYDEIFGEKKLIWTIVVEDKTHNRLVKSFAKKLDDDLQICEIICKNPYICKYFEFKEFPAVISPKDEIYYSQFMKDYIESNETRKGKLEVVEVTDWDD